MSSELAIENADQIAIQQVGLGRDGGVHLVWGHGWGRTGADMLPLAESLSGFVSSSVVDFPGFGNSPPPPNTWGTGDYADAIAKRIKSEPPCRRVWVGHSFGCRVGIQLAARYPGLFEGMILVAAAGLPRKRSISEQLRFAWRRYTFKTAKFLLKEGPRLEAMRNRLGSADYRKAGELRPVLVRVVNEDLTACARLIQCPVLLIYGRQDTETPVEIGVRLNQIIQNAKLVVLEGFDHHSLLSEGRHQVAHHILRFLKGNEQ